MGISHHTVGIHRSTHSDGYKYGWSPYILLNRIYATLSNLSARYVFYLDLSVTHCHVGLDGNDLLPRVIGLKVDAQE